MSQNLNIDSGKKYARFADGKFAFLSILGLEEKFRNMTPQQAREEIHYHEVKRGESSFLEDAKWLDEHDPLSVPNVTRVDSLINYLGLVKTLADKAEHSNRRY